MKRSFSTLACLVAVAWLARALPLLAANLPARYLAPPESPSWGGQVNQIPNTSNYVLTASAYRTNDNTTIRSVARLDRSGAVEWAVAATEGQRGQLSLQALAEEPYVFAKMEGLPDEDFWTVFGLFDGRDGRRIFERGIPVSVDQPMGAGYFMPDPVPSVEVLSDGRSAVLAEEPEGTIRVAVIDREGQPAWQHAVTSSSFAMAGRGSRSRLIDYPGKGSWLLVQGSRSISTEPNPPPVNTSLGVNLVRFDNGGQVLWTRKLGGLLTGMISLAVQPVAIRSDGTLILTLTDTVINTWGAPTLLELITYLVAISPDGELRWARRIPGMTLATPVLGADGITLFVIGQKLLSRTTFASESVVLRMNAGTGALLGQTAVSRTSVGMLSPAGVTREKLYVLGTTPGTSNLKAMVGALDVSLAAAHWKQFDRNPVATQALAFNPRTSTLLFSDTPFNERWIDAVLLDVNLNTIRSNGDAGANCQFFSDASATLTSSDLRAESIVLTPVPIAVTVESTDIPLIPTSRIDLRSIQPQSQDLCPAEDANPRVVLQRDASGGLTLSFASQSGRQYELLFSPDLGQPFRSIEAVAGDGKTIARPVGPLAAVRGFYSVRVTGP